MIVDVKDKIGQPLTVGDYVVYGHALGRCAGLRIGKILKIYEAVENYSNKKSIHFTVMGVDDDHPTLWPAALCERRGTLMFHDRIMKLSAETVPQEIKNLLEPVPLIKDK